MSGHSNYEPKTGFEKWLDTRLPIVRFAYDTAIDFPTPKNLNYWWTFGAILATCLVIQIITGVVSPVGALYRQKRRRYADSRANRPRRTRPSNIWISNDIRN